MYPNLYYVFKDWFGVEWHGLSFINTFGLLVALAFIVAAWVLSAELRRKEKQGLFVPKEETILVGSPASWSDLLLNGVIGFAFGYKIVGVMLSKPETIDPQAYIFSGEGNLLGGLLMASFLVGIKWWEKHKVRLKQPEKRIIRIWPHDRVGDFVVLGLIFGILGAKLFDNFEHWDEFMAHPIERLLSQSGLAFYGGLIVAAIAICWYAAKKSVSVKHLVDAAAPALMIAYAIGRLGCQLSGDGDWGVYNSAYISDAQGNVSIAQAGEFEQKLQQNTLYFTQGKTIENGQEVYVTDRTYASLDQVPHRSVQGPSFLPTWLFAYSYPMNVNKDGNPIPGITEDHNKVLPLPVFPTPLYEFIVCTFLFFMLWSSRKYFKAPLALFGLYLTFNGFERILMELIRVNNSYALLGLHITQAEWIAGFLLLAGLGLMWFSTKRLSKTAP